MNKIKIRQMVLGACMAVIGLAGQADEPQVNSWKGNNDRSWNDSVGDWSLGQIPDETQIARFDLNRSQLLKIKANTTVAELQVAQGTTLRLSKASSMNNGYTLNAGAFTGSGKIELVRTGLGANYAAGDTCYISVPTVEVIPDGSHDSWFQGYTEAGKSMVVEADVIGTGVIRSYGHVVFRNIVFENGGCRLHAQNACTIDKITVKAGTLDYPGQVASVSGVTVGEVMLDGGAVSIAPATTARIGTGTGGGTLVLTGEWTDEDAVALPSGVTFSDEADLTSVAVIATVGIAQVRYSVSKAGGSYVLKKERATSLVYTWTGAAGDKDWQNGANWDSKTVPTEENTACFAADADVVLKKAVKVQEVRVEEGARVVLRSSDIWNVHPSVDTWSVTGGGCLALGHAGLRSARTDQESLVISVATLEIINNCQGWSDDVTQSRDSWIEGKGNVPTVIESDLSGWRGSYLICRNALSFSGDNGGFLGRVVVDSVNNDGWSVRHFATPESLFSNANTFLFRSKMCLDFTEGTAKLGTVEFGESWGASFELKSDADVTLEVADGRIVDSYFGDGFEVNGGRLTVKKVGPGTLVYGVVKAHVLEVTEGRVEFTGEGDDSAVSVIVRAGASIGNAPVQTSGNGTKTGGAAVTVHHAFTFDEGAVVAQTISADEDGVLSVPVLTVAPAFDVTNVRFGFTNPELLPPVVRGTAYAKYPVADSPALTGGVRTVEDGIVPDGSARQCCWKAVPSGNTVIFRTYCPGLVVIVK